MEHEQTKTGTTRKLFVTEYHKYKDHLLRLDGESRRMRFGMSVDDEFIANYVLKLHDMKSIVFGHIIGGNVCAAAELRPLGSQMRGEAEAAFSVEMPYQDSGIGTELLRRLVRAARNRSIHLFFNLVRGCGGRDGFCHGGSRFAAPVHARGLRGENYSPASGTASKRWRETGSRPCRAYHASNRARALPPSYNPRKSIVLPLRKARAFISAPSPTP
jgi:hypothetical protein